MVMVAELMEIAMLEVVELDDRWSLTSQDANVTRVCFDWGVALTIGSVEPQTDIRIEQPIVLTDAGGKSIQLIPEGDPIALAPLLQIARRPLVRVEAFKDGRLEMSVANGVTLTVAPSDEFESWEITGPRDFRIVSVPGGELTVWSAVAS